MVRATRSNSGHLISAPTESALNLPAEQRRIRRNTALAAALCVATLLGAWSVLPLFFEPPETLPERLAFALQADLFVLVWIVVAVQMVSSGRYRSIADNCGSAFGPPSPRIAIKVAFLQNTLEQAVVAVGAHLALATLLTGRSLFYLPAAAALFCIGRVAFWRGYPYGAGARSFGMATTAIPTVVAYVWGLSLVVKGVLA